MTTSNPQTAAGFEAKLGTDILTRDEMLYSCLQSARYVAPPMVPTETPPRKTEQLDLTSAPSLQEMISLAKAIQTATAAGAAADSAPKEEQLTASATGDNTIVLQEIQRAAASAVSTAAANSSKSELASVLEGFARVLRDDVKYGTISYADHTAEVGQLKALLMEAQETIIGLLNDRVYDRAKLSKLETEARFYPDVQAQAHRAVSLQNQTEEMQTQLVHVKEEIDRLRTAYMRTQEEPKGWFARLFKQKD
jgi:hypothetical protein